MNDASQPEDGSQPALPPASPEPPPSGSQFSGQSSAPLNAHSPDPARGWNVACHVTALSGLLTGVGFIVGPLIVWLLKKADLPSVDQHGKESLNFQLTALIYYVVLMGVAALTCGVTLPVIVPLLFVIPIVQVVFVIVASLKASDGGFYRYPLTIRMIT